MGRHLHFDCFSGVSGDMVLGALVDAGLPLDDLIEGLKGVPAGGYRLRAKRVRRGALSATKVDVVIRKGFEKPLSLQAIRTLIASSRVPAPVKRRAADVFRHLADAEGIAHRVKPTQVRFHEVGVIDSIVDVIGGVLGCHLLGAATITASPINVGAGTIETEHGRLPVPGPAVAALAHGIPVYSQGPDRELTTPTGIALMKTLAVEFRPLPPLRITTIGCGAGTADPKGWPNALRLFVGESAPAGGPDHDTVVQVETNIDDLNPQVYDLVMDRLFAAGALDATLTPVIMKAGRPAIVLTALAPPEKADAVAAVLLKETSTLGVRIQTVARRILPRQFDEVRIAGGTVRMKIADLGDRRKAAPEYQDCRRIAERTGRPVRDVIDDAVRAWHARR